MTTATTQTAHDSSLTTESQIAARAIALNQAMKNTDQRKLNRQLVRSGVTCAISLAAGIVVFLFILFGPELGERASVFVASLLVVCACMFVVSLFAFLVPMLEALAVQKILAIQDKFERWELEEDNERLATFIREAKAADDVPAFFDQNWEAIKSLVADKPKVAT